MRTARKQLATVALLAFLLGCEQADTPGDGADTASVHPEIVPPAAAERVDTVHVVLREWSVAPARTTLSAGRVVFHVMNEGRYEHALEVEGGGEEKETDKIRPGGTATLEVDLKAGSYKLYCPVDDAHGKHEQRGMTTTVTVS